MTQSTLRIAFAGTPEFAAKHLQALLAHNCDVVAVYSQPDRPSGRGKKLKPSPVKTLALENNIAVFQPSSLNTPEAQSTLKALNLDLLVIVAYGLLLPPAVLSIPHHGCINVHASILPRWRGAAPIERAILYGDTETGISIMQMDEGLDTGDVLLTLPCPISPTMNSQELTLELARIGCKGLLTTIQQITQQTLSPIPQDDSTVPISCAYAKKLTKQEALLKWDEPANYLQRQINAFFPRSPAYCYINQQRIRIIHAVIDSRECSSPPGTIVAFDKNGLLVTCLQGSLRVTQLQLAGKKITTLKDLANNQNPPFIIGDTFYSEESPHE